MPIIVAQLDRSLEAFSREVPFRMGSREWFKAGRRGLQKPNSVGVLSALLWRDADRRWGFGAS